MDEGAWVANHWFVGLSLGRPGEHAAIAAIEQVSREKGKSGTRWTALGLRHLERLDLSASYPDIVGRAAAVMKQATEREKRAKKGRTEPSPELIVDFTGAGSACIDMMDKDGVRPSMLVTISASGAPGRPDPKRVREWRISRPDLVASLQALLQTDKLKVARQLPLVPEFTEEMEAFKMRRPSMRAEDLEAWRETPREDLVRAVAVAAWQAQRSVPSKPLPKRDDFRWVI